MEMKEQIKDMDQELERCARRLAAASPPTSPPPPPPLTLPRRNRRPLCYPFA